MLIVAGVVASALAPEAGGQASNRGQPTTAFAAGDFAKLRWLEGSWIGTSPDGRDIFERWHVATDSTIDVTYYSDSAFAHEAATGRIYLSVGRIFQTMGPGRWGATHVDDNGVYFVAQVNASNSFGWRRRSNDEWTSTERSGFAGQQRVVVYTMRRARP
ncbi:MAG: hypothetical protein ACREPM_04295 [Gemmatimonadaceae bacterium]